MLKGLEAGAYGVGKLMEILESLSRCEKGVMIPSRAVIFVA
jgi:hypothetical protein